MDSAKLKELEALRSAATQGEWHWIDPETDAPWEAGPASLRTVEKFGEDKTEVNNGLHYTSFALPKFILEATDITNEDAAYIAALHNAAPELFAAARRLEALERAMQETETFLGREQNSAIVTMKAIRERAAELEKEQSK